MTSPGGALRGGARGMFRDGLLRRVRQGRDAARTSVDLGRGHVRQGRGGLAGDIERSHGARRRPRDLDEEDFVKAAEAAKVGCPISQTLQGNVEISVEATLES